MAELIPVAQQWQAEEPESEDARYYQCAQRLYCGEGESLLARSLRIPGELPIYTSRNCCCSGASVIARLFRAVSVVIEAQSMVDAQDQPLKYVPGESCPDAAVMGWKFYIAENYRR